MIAEKGHRRGINIQDQIVIPAWVEDLASFRRWRLAEEAPSSGELAYLGEEIWVDLGMEEFLTHNQVKAAFEFAIMSVVQAASLGRYVPDRMLLTNEDADLSTEPDGLFFTWETVRSGRIHLVDKPGQGIMELKGTPDLVLEVVSKNSIRKDTVLLRDLYAKAGISEYWLVDAREGRAEFAILQWTREGYIVAPEKDGWSPSKVLGKAFQLQRLADPLGHAQFTVATREPSA